MARRDGGSFLGMEIFQSQFLDEKSFFLDSLVKNTLFYARTFFGR